jgi:hypothetical protein
VIIMLFSVIIPLQFHRFRALDCIRGWVSTQELSAAEFELVCVLPQSERDTLHDGIKALLRPHDRLLLSDETHDMTQCVQGAAAARGEFLFFTESHVWPERDVLKAVKEKFERHPDWAAFSCHTTRVAESALARMEADLYERDIDRAMRHPWRKILDQGFVTRREAYFEAGGLDPELEHYAEWVLSGRYFDRGLKVGYAPDITLCHYYIGDLAELRTFTESFVAGEIAFFDRGRTGDVVIWEEIPPEWSQRGRWDRKLAGAMATCLRKAATAQPKPAGFLTLLSHYLSRSAVALWGAGLAGRLAQSKVMWRRVLLAAAASGLHSSRVNRFEDYIAALVHAQRLKEIAARPCSSGPAMFVGGIAADDPHLEPHMAAFHLVERHNSLPMRWSEPAALVELSVPAGSCRIGIHCAPVRKPLEALSLMFFIDETPVPRNRIAFHGHNAVIALDRASPGALRLAWVCERFAAPGDARHLGLPLTRLTIESD